MKKVSSNACVWCMLQKCIVYFIHCKLRCSQLLGTKHTRSPLNTCIRLNGYLKRTNRAQLANKMIVEVNAKIF